MDQHWPVRLFNKSVLKQRKLKEITDLLGETRGLRCLDIGSDNGVVSYLLRQRGGEWKSADLDPIAVRSIGSLVEKDVFLIDGERTPFKDDEFDAVIIVDFLEHIHTDRQFVEELFRIIKPGGELIVNVPHIKNTLLRKFRLAIGQTDEKHGHVRPGYTPEGLSHLLKGKFNLTAHRTYSKFFSECIDAFITFGFGLFKKEGQASQKGVLVTEHDLRKYQKIFRLYALIYPVMRFFAALDRLLFRSSGYMLIAKARSTK